MRGGSLRLRTLLVFVALGLGSIGATALGLVVAHGRLGLPEATAPLVVAGAISAFGTAGLCALIWLLFDENAARPLTALAAALRTRAHGAVTAPLDPRALRHLGDLGPAAAALCARIARAQDDADAVVAQATARLAAEKAQLASILSEIPLAVMAVNARHRVTLYDRQCVQLLGEVAPLGLDRPVFDYLDHDALTRAVAALTLSGQRFADAALATADGRDTIQTRIRLIGREGGYLLAMETETEHHHALAERPLVFDVDLDARRVETALADLPLARLSCVVLDTETTGLDPQADAIVQIGAVRVLNARRVEGETFETLVDPGRPIPSASTRVHGIDDAAVRGAPPIAEAGRAFHRFARGSVIVAHNAPFDLAFLRRHEAAIGARFDHPVLDTVLLSAVVFGQDVPHTLDAIAARLGVRVDPAQRHSAMGDARVTAEVLLRLMPVLEAAGIATFGAAVAAMRRHQALLPDLNQG